MKLFYICKSGTNFQNSSSIVNSLPFKIIYILHLIPIVQIFFVFYIVECSQTELSIAIVVLLVTCIFQVKFLQTFYSSMRKKQIHFWSDLYKRTIDEQCMVNSMFSKWPDWIIDDIQFSPAYKTWQLYGPISIPIHFQQKMMERVEESRSFDGPREPRYEYYFTEMDHTDGSVGGNYYEGQIRVNYKAIDKPCNIPSIYLDPKRDGYGKLIFLTSLNENNTSHIDDILNNESPDHLQHCVIMEGQWQNGKLHGFGRTFDQYGNCYRGEYSCGNRSGSGSFFWPKGDVFDGNFKNNKQKGKGTFFFAETGEACTGIWDDDILDFEPASPYDKPLFFDIKGKQIQDKQLEYSKLYQKLRGQYHLMTAQNEEEKENLQLNVPEAEVQNKK